MKLSLFLGVFFSSLWRCQSSLIDNITRFPRHQHSRSWVIIKRMRSHPHAYFWVTDRKRFKINREMRKNPIFCHFLDRVRSKVWKNRWKTGRIFNLHTVWAFFYLLSRASWHISKNTQYYIKFVTWSCWLKWQLTNMKVKKTSMSFQYRTATATQQSIIISSSIPWEKKATMFAKCLVRCVRELNSRWMKENYTIFHFHYFHHPPLLSTHWS